MMDVLWTEGDEKGIQYREGGWKVWREEEMISEKREFRRNGCFTVRVSPY